MERSENLAGGHLSLRCGNEVRRRGLREDRHGLIVLEAEVAEGAILKRTSEVRTRVLQGRRQGLPVKVEEELLYEVADGLDAQSPRESRGQKHRQFSGQKARREVERAPVPPGVPVSKLYDRVAPGVHLGRCQAEVRGAVV
ncbi:MAG: hypothetical protein IPN17_04810 [Deltaproteobacteria bacterium]|nr:hypothetical protein [Deltaproteobacteria bacterium]